MDDDRLTAERLVEAYRFTLLEADLRDDVSPAERMLLLALVAESADELDRVGVGGGALAEELLHHLGDGPVSGLPEVRADTRDQARRAVSRVLARALAPGWVGVVVLLAGAVVLWARPYGDLRADGAAAAASAGVAVVGGLLVLLGLRSRLLVSELGAAGGSPLARAATVGAVVERLVDSRVRPLHAGAGPVPSTSVLATVRRRCRAAVRRLAAGSLVSGSALFLGLMRALGLL